MNATTIMHEAFGIDGKLRNLSWSTKTQ